MLTVITKAPTQDLTSLEAVKAELEVTGAADDAVLARLIRQASAMIATYCNRPLMAEKVLEVWRFDRPLCLRDSLRLGRAPVGQITSVTEDGGDLVAGTDYELDAEGGRLVRLAGDTEVPWWSRRVEVTYTAGYAPEALPPDLERACIDLVRRLYFGRSRDPALRSERILNVIDSDYTAADSVTTRGGLPLDLAGRLDAYRRVE